MVTVFRKVLFSLVFLSLWSGLAQCGMIYNKGFDMDFNNQGHATQYILRFSVQTSLPNTFSLRLVSPYDIGNAYTTFTQAGTWEYYDGDCSSTPSISGNLLVKKTQVTTESNTYYLRLNLTNNTLAGLNNSGRYHIYLNVDSSITLSSADGYHIGLSTVIGDGSSTDTKLVLIDRNDVFDYIAQGASVSTGVTYNFTAIGGQKNDLGGIYDVMFSFAADRDLSYGSRFRARIMSTEFSFVAGSCINQASMASGISAINATNLTYTYRPQMITFGIASPLVQNQIVRFICKIQNPPYVTTAKIRTYLMEYYANNVLAWSESSSDVLSVSSSTWQSIRTSIAWGYEITGTLEVERPLPIHLYSSYDSEQTVYNTIHFFLKTTLNLPTTVSLVVTCDLGTGNDDTKITVVPASIVNNFPAYNSLKPVTCSRSSTTIVCQNVGGLLLLNEYFLSFRFSIPAGLTPSLSAKFSITDSNSNILIPPSATTSTASINSTALQVTQNININPMIKDPSDYGFRMFNLVHMMDLFLGEIQSNTLYGLRSDMDSIYMVMIFEHNFDLQTLFGSSTYGEGDGIEYFMPYNMNNSIFNDTENCLVETATVTVCEMNSVIKTSSANFTRFRFAVEASEAAYFFPTTGVNDTIVQNLTIFPFGSLPKVSNTFYANDRLYDFFGRSVRGSIKQENANVDVLTTASVKEWLINSYVVTSNYVAEDQLTNLVAGFSHYWASTTTGNDASNFPTVIRVVGSLNAADGTGAKALSVFFRGLTPLALNSDGTYPCASSWGNLTCYLAVGDSNNGLFYPQAMSRFDVNLSGLTSRQYSARFQIILPVATSTNTVPVYLGLALHDSQIRNSVYYLNTRIYKMSVYNYTVTSADLSTFYDTSLKIMVPTGARIGDIDFSNTTKIPPPAIKLEGNDKTIDGMVGASMQLCGIWNFFSDSGFGAASIPSETGQAANDQCLTYSYGTKYCLFCPVASTYSITNAPQQIQRLSYPYVYSTSATYEYYLSYSTNYGNLSAAGRDALTINLSPVTPKLRVKNLITINDMVSDPTNLVTPSINNRLTFSFIAPSNFPKNCIITIVFNDTRPFASSSSATCLFVNSYNTSCTLGYPDTNNITVTLTGTSDFSSTINSYIILTGVDIDIGSEKTFGYSFVIADSSNTLQTVWLDDMGTFTVTQSSLTFSPQFTLSNISPGALASLTITFTLPKVLLTNEVIQVNLGSLNSNSANQLSELACTGEAAGILASQCDTTSGTNILITFAQEIPASASVTITLKYIFVPSANITTADYSVTILRSSTSVMTAFGNTFEVDGANGLNQIVATPLTLTKKYNTPGDILELEFVYTLQNDMNSSTTISIHFPPVYPNGLGHTNLHCTINDQYTHCGVHPGDRRMIQLTSVNTTIEAETQINIKIYGVQQPKAKSNFQIFLTHDTDDNSTVITEFAFVDDVLPSAAPAQLATSYFSSSSSALLTTTTYQFEFTSPSESLSLITVNFPDINDTLISSATGFGCTLVDSTNTTVELESCKIFGSRVKAFVDGALQTSSKYVLSLTSFPNPGKRVCNMSKVTLALATSDEATTKYYTYPNLMNQGYRNIVLNTSVKVLGIWGSPTTSYTSMILPNDIIEVIIGVYSQVYYVAPISGDPFIKTVNFTLENSIFTIIKPPSANETSVTLGDQNFPFRLGCNSTASPSIYRVSILKNETDTDQLYTVPPQLTVKAVNKTVNITPADTTASVGGGSTLPITFDLSEHIPFDNLTITATIAPNSTNSLSSLTPLTIVFNTTNTYGFFQFNTSSALVKGATATILLELGGANKDIYNLTKSWVTITITGSASNGPKILIRQPIVENSTKQAVSIYSSQVSTIYWGVALYDSVVRDCYYIYEAAFNNHTYNSTDPMQEQFGIVPVTIAASDVTFLISNLRANASYQIIACALNQQFYNSTTQTNSWTMKNNNSTVIRGQLFFQFSLTAYQEYQLVCYLANYFSLNYEA